MLYTNYTEGLLGLKDVIVNSIYDERQRRKRNM